MYKQYAELKEQIKELQEQAKELEKHIFNELLSVEGNKLETDYATFSLQYRPKWQYSDEYTTKERQVKNKLKELQLEEQKTGKAKKLADGGFLRCQIVKSTT